VSWVSVLALKSTGVTPETEFFSFRVVSSAISAP
jgi:hypothetical protein